MLERTARTEEERHLPAALGGLHGRIRDVLDRFAPEVRGALLASARIEDIPAGAVVVPEGQRSERVGYVLDGALGMRKTLLDGRTHLIGLLVPTDMFGRFFDGPSTYDLVALSDTRSFTFDRAIFERAMSSSPEVERQFLVNLLDELDAAREWILMLSGHRVTERVASFLLVMLRRSGGGRSGGGRSGGGRVVQIPISRHDLAHHLGTRPESLSRAFHQLQKSGAIEILDPYTIRVMDAAALVEASGADLVVEDV
jgi:CRP/FNR family transcriptional regulator